MAVACKIHTLPYISLRVVILHLFFTSPDPVNPLNYLLAKLGLFQKKQVQCFKRMPLTTSLPDAYLNRLLSLILVKKTAFQRPITGFIELSLSSFKSSWEK